MDWQVIEAIVKTILFSAGLFVVIYAILDLIELAVRHHVNNRRSKTDIDQAFAAVETMTEAMAEMAREARERGTITGFTGQTNQTRRFGLVQPFPVPEDPLRYDYRSEAIPTKHYGTISPVRLRDLAFKRRSSARYLFTRDMPFSLRVVDEDKEHGVLIELLYVYGVGAHHSPSREDIALAWMKPLILLVRDKTNPEEEYVLSVNPRSMSALEAAARSFNLPPETYAKVTQHT